MLTKYEVVERLLKIAENVMKIGAPVYDIAELRSGMFKEEDVQRKVEQVINGDALVSVNDTLYKVIGSLYHENLRKG